MQYNLFHPETEFWGSWWRNCMPTLSKGSFTPGGFLLCIPLGECSRNTRNTESNSAEEVPSKCMWAAMPLGNIWWHQWPLTNTQVPTIMFWSLPTSQTSLLYSVKGVMNSNFGKSNCNFCKINFGNSNCNFGKLQANRVPWGMTVAPPAPPSMGVHTCQGWVG